MARRVWPITLTMEKLLPIIVLLAFATLVSGCASCPLAGSFQMPAPTPTPVPTHTAIVVSTSPPGPTIEPTPTQKPVSLPTETPTAVPTSAPTVNPTEAPTPEPSPTPTPSGTTLPDGSILATPMLMLPTDGAELSDMPRSVTFQWQPVDGANGYFVEVQIYDGNWSGIFNQTTSDATFTSGWNGKNPGRWRVTATDSTGTYSSSAPSEWYTFEYTV